MYTCADNTSLIASACKKSKAFAEIKEQILNINAVTKGYKYYTYKRFRLK